MMKLTDKAKTALENIQANYPDSEFQAKDVGAASATLTSLVKKGYLIVTDDSSPKTYKLVEGRVLEEPTMVVIKDHKKGKTILELEKVRSEIKSSINTFEHCINDDDFASLPSSQVGIYKITYLPDPSKIYIGKTDRPFEKRWNEHRKNLEAGIHHCEALQKQFNECGKHFDDFKFEVLQRVEYDHTAIDMRERYWIQKYEEDENYTLFNTMKPKLHM